MLNNMANLDRVIRALLAVVIIVLYLMGQITGTALIILAVIAVIFIVTSILGYCPLYHMLGISTKKK